MKTPRTPETTETTETTESPNPPSELSAPHSTEGAEDDALNSGALAADYGIRSPARASAGRILAIARRHWLVLKRSPHRFFDVMVWPVVDTLLYGSIALFAAEAAGSSPSTAATLAVYLLSGTVLWHLVHQTQISLATGFLEETWSRNLLSLLATPLREWEYLAGVGLFALVRTAMSTAAVAGLALAAYSFDVTTLGIGLIPVAALLLVCGWAVALLVVGLVLRFGSGAEALAWGAMSVVMPLSGVFYPVSTLPAALRPIAEILPTTHVFAAGRALNDGGPMPWRELGIAAGGTGLLLVVSMFALGRMLRTFRRRGMVTRYS